MEEVKKGLVAKAKRAVTSLLPVSQGRVGSCVNCGKCCMLPMKCLFLKFRPDNTSYCSINSFKPLSCRKYPRTASECLTTDTCGFSFNK